MFFHMLFVYFIMFMLYGDEREEKSLDLADAENFSSFMFTYIMMDKLESDSFYVISYKRCLDAKEEYFERSMFFYLGYPPEIDCGYSNNYKEVDEIYKRKDVEEYMSYTYKLSPDLSEKYHEMNVGDPSFFSHELYQGASYKECTMNEKHIDKLIILLKKYHDEKIRNHQNRSLKLDS